MDAIVIISTIFSVLSLILLVFLIWAVSTIAQNSKKQANLLEKIYISLKQHKL